MKKICFLFCAVLLLGIFYYAPAFSQIQNESDNCTLRGKRLFTQQRRTLAIPLFQQALDLRKTNGMAAFYLAQCYSKERDVDSAIKVLEDFLKNVDAAQGDISSWDAEFIPQIRELLAWLKSQQ